MVHHAVDSLEYFSATLRDSLLYFETNSSMKTSLNSLYFFFRGGELFAATQIHVYES